MCYDLRKGSLNTVARLRVLKVLNTAETAFADRALLLNENELLFEQNNEAVKRKLVKSKVIGTAKVLSYEDLITAKQECDIKEVEGKVLKGKCKRKRDTPTV